MKTHAIRPKASHPVLATLGESIGITLGALAAKMKATREAVTGSPIAAAARQRAGALAHAGKRTRAAAKRHRRGIH